MKKLFLFFMWLAFGLSLLHAEDNKTPIPKNDKWEKTENRDNSSPQLYQSESSPSTEIEITVSVEGITIIEHEK